MSPKQADAPNGRVKRRRLSYANVASTLALVIALGAGTAYAAHHHWLITSKSEIKPSVLHALSGKIGAPGATGVTGPVGSTGATGVPGPPVVNNVVQWNATVATAGSGIGSPNTVPLATVGPFTILGYCYIATTHTDAATYATTSQNSSALDEYDSNTVIPWNSGDPLEVSEETVSGTTSTSTPAFSGPYDGSWALSTANGGVVVNGFANEGVFMQGSTGPACSFSGYLVKQGA